MVDMIDQLSGLGADDLTVHRHPDTLAALGSLIRAERVGCPRMFSNRPSHFREPPVVRLIDEGVFAVRQGYASIGRAVAQAAPQDDGGGDGLVEPIRDVDDDFDSQPCVGAIL